MSGQQQTSNVYVKVIEDVIHKIRDGFAVNNGGPGEIVLNKLQELWEAKLIEKGSILGAIERPSLVRPTPGGPIPANVAYEGTEGYETPTVELLFPSSVNFEHQDFLVTPGKRKREDSPSQYHNGFIPQQHLAGDTVSDELMVENAGEGPISANQKSRQGFCCGIREVDVQVPEQYNDAFSTPTIFNNGQAVVNEDYNIVTPAPNDLQTGTPAIVNQNDVAYDVDDEELNENDDDDDDDLDDFFHDGDPDKNHLVLAQFDKVSRIKSTWKCTLKDGIIHKNNSEILFNKANGEFNF